MLLRLRVATGQLLHGLAFKALLLRQERHDLLKTRDGVAEGRLRYEFLNQCYETQSDNMLVALELWNLKSCAP